MRALSFCLLFVAGLLLSARARAQDIDPAFLQAPWPAQWITVPGIDGTAYGVYLFRKELALAAVPDSFPVYLSADNHYTLYVNGELINRGPAKHDLNHWNYDRLDLAPFLRTGENSLAVRVWNAGAYRQEAQLTYQTALLMQGASEASTGVNTDTSWVCRPDDSYQPVPVASNRPRSGTVGVPGYYVAGPGDRVDMAQRVAGWNQPDFDAAGWPRATSISAAIPRNSVGMDAREPWRLVHSPVPPMERMPERFATVRRAEGMTVPDGFPEQPVPVTVPASTTAVLLLDQSYLTNAFPTLTLSGGAGGSVRLTYAEALYEADLRTKGHRDELAGKQILGRQDTVLTDGSARQTFTPLSYRTYRYVELTVTTAADPLTIRDISAEAVGFPFERKARLESPLPEMDTILDVGWRTARLCAMDTYMDCPYWEQLQYIGDARIQALISLYTTGDDRLVKNALDLMDHSRQPEGITTSRYPTNIEQIIGPFSLWYVGMLRDYLRYGSDRAFLQDKLSGARQVLDYFHHFQDASGSLRNLPNWSFTDWLMEWPRGEPPVDAAGYSAVLDLQLLLAYQYAAELEAELGMPAFADLYQQRADQLATTIRERYWDADRTLFADTGDHDRYSQHGNSLAVLAGLVPEADLPALGANLLEDTDLAPASIYFRYYLHQALVRAGRGDDYLRWLDVWRTNLDLGLTTWAEDSDVAAARSDCHAWGSSPNIEFFRTLLGIDSASPHFRTVRIAPHLGGIQQISGEMPHPAGMISVAYDTASGEARISLPVGVTGTFAWKGTTTALVEGENVLRL